MSARRSGLQPLRALRMVRTKPPATQPKFLLFVQHSFRTQASSVSGRDVAAIEHLLRKGRRQLEGLEDPGVRDCWVSAQMRQWQQTAAQPRNAS
ncbi:hypothetical protein HWV62_3695 [Athelia sp. TMB]|nr:hypothetical protein HWV62_3695 [Athelia sp. TMB]